MNMLEWMNANIDLVVAAIKKDGKLEGINITPLLEQANQTNIGGKYRIQAKKLLCARLKAEGLGYLIDNE